MDQYGFVNMPGSPIISFAWLTWMAQKAVHSYFMAHIKKSLTNNSKGGQLYIKMAL